MIKRKIKNKRCLCCGRIYTPTNNCSKYCIECRKYMYYSRIKAHLYKKRNRENLLLPSIHCKICRNILEVEEVDYCDLCLEKTKIDEQTADFVVPKVAIYDATGAVVFVPSVIPNDDNYFERELL